MSHHILHILAHGSLLRRERGFLTCREQEGNGVRPVGALATRRLPLEDLRAVVIAARGVTLTSNAVSGILESDGILLHCDSKYRPCGLTSGLARIVNPRTMLRQGREPRKLNARLWANLLHCKVTNQIEVLQRLGVRSAYLTREAARPRIDEGNCARCYWRHYFPSIGWKSKRERTLKNPPNSMLNYGYAILLAMCHRAILIHGLSPLHGVGHAPHYRSQPLVYDLMEAYRPFIDWSMAKFLLRSVTTKEDLDIRAWAKHASTDLLRQRVMYRGKRIRLLYALDKSAASLAECYREGRSTLLWLPRMAQATC